MSQVSISHSLKHYVLLDGMRGIAAFSVLLFHFMEWIYTDPKDNFIGHGFLAVDFFFCLSGFVIGYAYDNRMDRMSIGQFVKLRLIRLHPLVVIGTILGLLTLFIDPFGGLGDLSGFKNLCIIFLAGILMIPYPASADRGFNLFSLNAPSWSLFWEYIANLVYVLILARLRKSYLLVLTVFAAILLCFVGFRAGNLLGGWSGSTFWDGGARVFFSFCVGLLIYRYGLKIPNSLNFVGLAFLLLVAFLVPTTSYNWIVELIIVLFYFPVLIMIAVGAKSAKQSNSTAILLGDLSYPLYMTHYCALWVFGHYLSTRQDGSISLVVVVAASMIVLLLFAYIIMKYVDKPIMSVLKQK